MAGAAGATGLAGVAASLNGALGAAGFVRRIEFVPSRDPIVGDWDANGVDSVGLYFDPTGWFAQSFSWVVLVWTTL